MGTTVRLAHVALHGEQKRSELEGNFFAINDYQNKSGRFT
jgi:hypothetical protein